MDTQLIVTILGAYMVVSGLAMLIRGKTFPLVVQDLFEHRALMWLAGFFLMFVGGSLAFASSDMTWAPLLGWLIILKGALYILAPEFFTRLFRTPSTPAIVASGIIVAAIGAWLLSVSAF